jgi:DNA-binding NarL/FixJ family response regulator
MNRELTTKPLRIIIADKNQVYPAALQNFIRKRNDVELINVCKTEEELILILRGLGITCLIVDEGFFEQDVVMEIRSIKQQYPNLKIVGLSIDGSSHMNKEMILAGACKYVSKWNLEKELPLLVQSN